MLRYIITKILNKYKLYLCLVIGIVSIVMVFAMIMMFRDGSRSKLIQRGFVSQNEKTHQFPMTLSRKGRRLETGIRPGVSSAVVLEIRGGGLCRSRQCVGAFRAL